MNQVSELQSNRIDIQTSEAKSLNLHYLQQGQGSPILLLHGWPTSAHLWRNVMPHMARNHRVIALDLPGFGLSDKPLDVTYSFRFYNQVISAFLDALSIDKTAIVVHDLGGPVGVRWVVDNPERVTALGILNTLVYPELSWAVKAFMAATHLPFIKQWITSARGLKGAMKFGTQTKTSWQQEEIQPYLTPFTAPEARKALLKAAQGLSPKGFKNIERGLANIDVPVRLIYGENDRILPDIADTMQRLKGDFPDAELTVLKQCGHFLQEDNPEEIGRLLGVFFDEVYRVN